MIGGFNDSRFDIKLKRKQNSWSSDRSNHQSSIIACCDLCKIGIVCKIDMYVCVCIKIDIITVYYIIIYYSTTSIRHVRSAFGHEVK